MFSVNSAGTLSFGSGIVSNGHLRLLKASGEMSSVSGR